MSRRYGKVEKSPGVTLNEMLMLHQQEVFAWIAGRTGLEVERGEERKEGDDLVMSLENADVDNGVAEECG